eukprot:322119-Hanusia_phi.AAC.4
MLFYGSPHPLVSFYVGNILTSTPTDRRGRFYKIISVSLSEHHRLLAVVLLLASTFIQSSSQFRFPTLASPKCPYIMSA